VRRQDQQVAPAAIVEDGRWLGKLHDELRGLLAPVFVQPILEIPQSRSSEFPS
jgi:hypothetical protein